MSKYQLFNSISESIISKCIEKTPLIAKSSKIVNMSTETSDFEDDFDARDALNDLIEDLPSREASGLQNVFQISL